MGGPWRMKVMEKMGLFSMISVQKLSLFFFFSLLFRAVVPHGSWANPQPKIAVGKAVELLSFFPLPILLPSGCRRARCGRRALKRKGLGKKRLPPPPLFLSGVPCSAYRSQVEAHGNGGGFPPPLLPNLFFFFAGPHNQNARGLMYR